MHKTIDQHIAAGETGAALEQTGAFLRGLSDRYLADWFQLSARYGELDGEYKKGMLSHEEYQIELNKIHFALLALFNVCREAVRNHIPATQVPSSHEQNLEQLLKDKLFGKYKVLEKVGEGSTGLVFRGKDEFSGRDVAIKVLKVNTTDLQHAKQEVEQVARFKHRGIIKIYDVYFDSYPRCIITEFISGINLDKLIRNTGALPLARTRELLCQLGDVLNYIRHRKVRHTTIRPSKIHIDEEGQPVLSPFEVIKSGRANRNLEKVLQDCAYLSPEKLALTDSSEPFEALQEEQSDQFSIGVLAYEMLTGRRLFKGESIPDIIEGRNRFFKDSRFRQKQLSALDEYPQMKRILLKMLQQQPARRYDDLKSALRAIDAIRVGEKPWLVKAKDSYNRCLLGDSEFIAHFYQNLFRALPEVQGMFGKDSDQNRMLQNAIILLLESDGNRNFLERIRQSPRHGGLSALHFEIFVEQLIQTASEHDEKWSEELKKAWQQTTEPALKILRKVS